MTLERARQILKVPISCTEEQIRVSFRTLSRLYHPDVAGGSSEKFIDLQAARDLLLAPPAPVMIHDYAVMEAIGCTNHHQHYRVKSCTSGQQHRLLLRCDDKAIAIRHQHNILESLWVDQPPTAPPFIPKPLEILSVNGRLGLVRTESDCVSVQDVIESCTVRELDFRHVVWMGNRFLTVLKLLEDRSIQHGQLDRQHCMVGPFRSLSDDDQSGELDHGCWVVGWGSAKKLKPSEPSKDLRDLATVLESITSVRSAHFKAVLDWMRYQGPGQPDVPTIQALWKDAALDVYGPPHYLPLTWKRSR